MEYSRTKEKNTIPHPELSGQGSGADGVYRKERTMKLSELQNILGEEIIRLRGDDATKESVQRAQTVAMLAKQIINNADVIIRFDKLKAIAPELSPRIEELI